MGFINADTILMGHGLENDLRSLKLIHAVVIDTSVVFPHFYGLPFRRSLRSLVSSYLKRDIQVTMLHKFIKRASVHFNFYFSLEAVDTTAMRTPVLVSS